VSSALYDLSTRSSARLDDDPRAGSRTTGDASLGVLAHGQRRPFNNLLDLP
jgi:hypothetical protein